MEQVAVQQLSLPNNRKEKKITESNGTQNAVN
jgi:hypothetical protein